MLRTHCGVVEDRGGVRAGWGVGPAQGTGGEEQEGGVRGGGLLPSPRFSLPASPFIIVMLIITRPSELCENQIFTLCSPPCPCPSCPRPSCPCPPCPCQPCLCHHQMISFQKIYGLFGLKHHTTEINGDVTMGTNKPQEVKIELVNKLTKDS